MIAIVVVFLAGVAVGYVLRALRHPRPCGWCGGPDRRVCGCEDRFIRDQTRQP